jgi:hypothetical protein
MPVRLGVGVVQRLAADRAEPGAIGAADGLGWKRQDHRIVRPALHIELPFGDVGAAKLLVPGCRLVHLAGVDLEREASLLQAANARAHHLGLEAQP